MAEFTPDIQAPASAWMIGRGADAPKSIIGGLADVATKAIDTGIDIFRQNKQNNLESQEGEELSQAVRDYANPSAPPLVGQNTNPAETDPGFQSAKGEMDRHASAASQGAPGAKQALLTRLSEIQSRYATQNPYYAPALAEHAQKILGFNANDQLFQVASQAEEFQKKLSEGAQTTLMQKAADAGAVHYDQNGNVDNQATILNGQTIASEERKVDLALKQAQLVSAQSKPSLTNEQQSDLEFRTSRPYVDSVANASTEGLYSNLQAAISKMPTGKPMDQAMWASTIGVAEAKATASFDQWASDKNLSANTIETYHKYISQKFDPIRKLAGGDLSDIKQITQGIQMLKDMNIAKFHQVAPHIAAAIDVGGPQAAAALIQSSVGPATGTPAWEQMSKEANTYFSPPPSMDDSLRNGNGVMNGTYSIPNEPNPLKARDAIERTGPIIDNFAQRPHKLDDKEQKALGNIIGQHAAAAVQTGDPQQILTSAGRLTNPGVVQALVNYAKNPNNAEDAPKNLAFYGQYLQKTLQASATVLSQGADTKITDMTWKPNTAIGFGTKRIGGEISVHYSATAGADGKVTPLFVATNDEGKAVQLTDLQKHQVMNQDKNFGRVMDTYSNTIKSDKQVIQAFKEPSPKPEQAEAGRPKTNPVFKTALLEAVPGARITSEGRSPDENKAVHGSAHSMHMKGQAIDFVPEGKPWSAEDLQQFASRLDEQGLPHTELFIEHKGDPHSTGYHVHWGFGEKA